LAWILALAGVTLDGRSRGYAGRGAVVRMGGFLVGDKIETVPDAIIGHWPQMAGPNNDWGHKGWTGVVESEPEKSGQDRRVYCRMINANGKDHGLHAYRLDCVQVVADGSASLMVDNRAYYEQIT